MIFELRLDGLALDHISLFPVGKKNNYNNSNLFQQSKMHICCMYNIL